MTLRKTVVTLHFWAEYPEDDWAADQQADRISDDLKEATEALPYVADGSVSVHDFDTVEDDPE